MMEWGYCVDDFDVPLKITYDDNTKTFAGEINVSPCPVLDYGPQRALGGGYTFTGTRQEDRDDDDDEAENEDDGKYLSLHRSDLFQIKSSLTPR
jgi:hypothetical protein